MGKETLFETEIVLEVPAGYRDNARVDSYLTAVIPNATRSRVARGISEGRVRINDSVITKSSIRIQPGDVIVCTVMKPRPIVIEPEDIPLDIHHEDDDVIVLVKPAGMVVHPAYGHRTGTLVNAVLFHLHRESIEIQLEASSPGFPALEEPAINSNALRPGIVHRLDKDTSGLMVVAKNPAALSMLGSQFHEHSVGRTYHAILWGTPNPESGRISTTLGRSLKDRRQMAVVADGKHSVTNYQLVEHLAFTSLVQFTLETGRTHQIRVHAKHIGHPVFGDTTYGGDRILFGPQTKNRNAFHRNLFSLLPSQALHASHLAFDHPTSGRRMSFDAPLPSAFQQIVDRLRRPVV